MLQTDTGVEKLKPVDEKQPAAKSQSDEQQKPNQQQKQGEQQPPAAANQKASATKAEDSKTAPGEQKPADKADASTNKESTSTNTGQEGLRKPFQDDILKSLLRDREAAQTIPRQDPGLPAQRPAILGGNREISGLMPDGTPIVERPGRFYRTGDKKMIELRLAGGERRLSLELLPNAMLEALEREASTGATEFTVSGELTRYGKKNYLLLRKVVQRVDNGNLAPWSHG